MEEGNTCNRCNKPRLAACHASFLGRTEVFVLEPQGQAVKNRGKVHYLIADTQIMLRERQLHGLGVLPYYMQRSTGPPWNTVRTEAKMREDYAEDRSDTAVTETMQRKQIKQVAAFARAPGYRLLCSMQFGVLHYPSKQDAGVNELRRSVHRARQSETITSRASQNFSSAARGDFFTDQQTKIYVEGPAVLGVCRLGRYSHRPLL